MASKYPDELLMRNVVGRNFLINPANILWSARNLTPEFKRSNRSNTRSGRDAKKGSKQFNYYNIRGSLYAHKGRHEWHGMGDESGRECGG